MDLNKLIQNIDIVEYISQFVELEENGDEFWGISPFTFPPENTPSFSVRRENKTFYCFSSGVGGNVFTFTKFCFKCSPAEAVNKLAEYVGVDTTQVNYSNKLLATKIIQKYSNTAIKTSKRNTNGKKGVVLQDDYMDRYEVNSDKLEVWRSEGISDEVLNKFQVRYDTVFDSIVYPIRNINGNIVNVGARTLKPDWKQKGLRKYSYRFSWGTLNTIYGLFENMEDIKKRREIIIFEGCKSVLIAQTWGVNNASAILTSHLNPAQMKILARLGVRVVFALDAEVDIRKDRNIKTLKNYVNVEFIRNVDNLLDEKDSPVDKGREVFRELYRHRVKFK